MAGETNAYFGFELLNKLFDNQLNKKEDVIVLCLHWFLVKNSFKCIGLGDSKIFDASSDQGSELLPAEWNLQANYSLRYVKESQLYIVIAIKSDLDLMINFMRVDNNAVSNIQFPIDATVENLHGSLEAQIPTYRTVVERIRKELVEPVYTGSGREISTQTAERSETTERRRDPDDDPLRVGPLRRAPRQPWNPEADPRNIGRSDLDPFSHGGGMIFDPFTPQRGIPNPLDPRGPGGLGVPGRLPLGAVPPGARFDPFGPPDIDLPRRSRDPDADHLPPPGYDDMFM